MTDAPNEAEAPRFTRGAPVHDSHFRKFTAKQRLVTYRMRMLARWHKRRLVPPVTTMDGKHVWPVSYPYGVRSSAYELGYHTGEDHACDVGNAARATTYGHVVHAGPSGEQSGWGSDYGVQVLIRTADGRYDYAHNHLRAVRVQEGQKVSPGMLVGITGETGNVTGPHSHFEARPAGGGFGSDVHPYLVKRKKH